MQTGSGTQLFEKGQNFISFIVAFVAHSCTMYSPAVDCCSVLFGIRPTATAVPSGSGTYLLKPLAILLLLYDTYLLFICMKQETIETYNIQQFFSIRKQFAFIYVSQLLLHTYK